MRLTKKIVAAGMRRHSTSGVYDRTIINVGDMVDFYIADDDCQDLDLRAEKNALRWGWVDEYSRLTRAGYNAR